MSERAVRMKARACWMRALAGGLLVGATLAGGCARRVPLPPVVATPHYPDFMFPDVPPDVRQPALSKQQENGWRWLQAGDLRMAERQFTGALKTSPVFFPAEAAMGYLELARKEFGDALARFDRALRRRNTYVPALLGRGEALLALKREPEALESFEAALRVDASLGDVRRRIEVLRFRGVQENLVDARRAADAGRYDEAVEAYERAIAASPDSAFLYRDVAAIERKRGRMNPSLEYLEKAVALEPNDAASLVQIGEILETRGEIEAAIAAYTDAVGLEPDETIQKRIDNLRDNLRAGLALALLPPEYRAIGHSSPLTRGELAALIGVRLADVLQSTQRQIAAVITDTRGHWALRWIIAVARAGVMAPYPNHTFQPKGIVRRADLAQAASRILNVIAARQPELLKRWQAAQRKIADVSGGNLNYADASLAVAAGVIPLLDGDTFQLSRPVSGAEAIEVIDRLEALARDRPGAD